MPPRFEQSPSSPSIPDMIRALNRAGWSIGVAGFVQCGPRLSWTVSGVNGENRIVAEGATEAEAWRAACEQARGLGMLKGGIGQ